MKPKRHEIQKIFAVWSVFQISAIIFMREIIFSDMTKKTAKHYLTRYVIFIVCNLIDNSSQPMSEQELLQLLGKKRKWKCVTYLWSSISYQLSKGQSKCIDLHWMEILLHCFYLRILTDLIFPFTFRMQARQTSEGHIVNCLSSCTLIRTKNLTLRLNSGRWIKDRNLLFRSKVT